MPVATVFAPPSVAGSSDITPVPVSYRKARIVASPAVRDDQPTTANVDVAGWNAIAFAALVDPPSVPRSTMPLCHSIARNACNVPAAFFALPTTRPME